MPCYNPQAAWWEYPTREDLEAGINRRISFRNRGSALEADLQIPCGKCTGCRATQARDWAVRMYHESLEYDQCSFITLTFDQEHLPPAIDRKHVQDWIKRLRRSIPNLRYFVTGEYGEKTRRPHYHAVIFGSDFRGHAIPVRDDLWTNAHLSDSWPFGFATAGAFELGSCMYVAGYVQKKIADQDTFSIMSKGSIRRTNGMLPPIGYRWAERHIDQLARFQRITIEGQTFKIPPVYFTWFPEALDQVKGNAGKHVQQKTLLTLRNQEENRSAFRALHNKETV